MNEVQDLIRVPVAMGPPGDGRHFFQGRTIEQYRLFVGHHVARVDVSPASKNGFASRILEHQIGQIRVAHIQSDPLEIIRSARCIDADRQSHYIVGLNLRGHMRVNHYHHCTTVDSDQMFLLDKASPYHSTVTESADRILFSVPRRLLENRLPDASRYLRATPSIASGIGYLASSHLQFLMREGHTLGDVNQTHVIGMCIDLIALSFRSFEDSVEEPDRNSAGGRLLLSRVKAHLQCVLTDPELSPAKVADELCLSKRYLHKLFSDSGTTFGAWVRRERLLRTQALLADPRFSHLTITEIAMQQGFNDMPNFSRQFKAHFRHTPSAARSHALKSEIP